MTEQILISQSEPHLARNTAKMRAVFRGFIQNTPIHPQIVSFLVRLGVTVGHMSDVKEFARNAEERGRKQ